MSGRERWMREQEAHVTLLGACVMLTLLLAVQLAATRQWVAVGLCAVTLAALSVATALRIWLWRSGPPLLRPPDRPYAGPTRPSAATRRADDSLARWAAAEMRPHERYPERDRDSTRMSEAIRQSAQWNSGGVSGSGSGSSVTGPRARAAQRRRYGGGPDLMPPDSAQWMNDRAQMGTSRLGGGDWDVTRQVPRAPRVLRQPERAEEAYDDAESGGNGGDNDNDDGDDGGETRQGER